MDNHQPPSFSESDYLWMQKALNLAKLAEGKTSPNPIVGCVIVRDGQIIGEGYHHEAGTPHAEIHALNAAGASAWGASAYVTLEPCSHYGRTPPCSDALIDAGIKKVFVAMVDPNPLVAGKGILRLREAGIEVHVGLLAEQATHSNEVFIKAITTALPFVVYKTAMTLDGKISTESGDARWVSSENSRQLAHKLRNLYDVIMVGSETVQKDDPLLNCRLPGGKDPVRLVVDGTLRLSEEALVLSSSRTAPCIVATSLAAPQEKLERLKHRQGIEVWQYPSNRYVPLITLMRDLVQRGWTSILLEGGGRLAGQMLKADLIDKIELFLAPKLVGGNGHSPLSDFAVPSMAEAIPLSKFEVSLETGDIHISGYLPSRTRDL
ncbi:MAG: bifunctional diaminohydroxyphosphoribosylaminopyrimidine deaminase/5-amino-6-(5-phosphoribosylamino)uracil reductase RibD [Desulfitobacteriaceae bacterium]